MKSQKELLFQFNRLLIEYKSKIMISIVLLIISTVCIVYAPKIAGQTVNIFENGIAEDEFYDLLINLTLLVILTVAGYLLKAVSSKIMITVAEKVTFSLRMKLYDGLLAAQLKNIHSNTSGNIMARINNDLMNVRNFIMVYLSEFLAVVLTVVLSSLLMLTTDWRLGLCYLCLLPVYILCLYLSTIKSRLKYKNHQNAIGKMIGFMGDSISNHILIKVYGSQDYFERNFEKINDEIDIYYKSSRFITGLIPPISQLITNLGNIGVYLYGVYLLINHEILLGSLLTVVLYIQIATKPFRRTGSILTSMETSFASLDRVFEVIEMPYNMPRGKVELNKDDVEGAIEFRNVNYGDVIHDFNLKVEPGEIVALTGPIGSGKSLLMDLLLGLYELDSGEILLDSQNIYDMDPISYKSIYGYVPQEKWIFNGTFAENIGYGVDDYTLDDIKRASEIVGLGEIIETFPDKYDAKISDEKNNISSSERELICLARAIIRNPKVLILDDVHVNIRGVVDKRTVFVISDDDRVIEKCDKVVEIKK